MKKNDKLRFFNILSNNEKRKEAQQQQQKYIYLYIVLHML